jgi:hypothetical protein
MRFAIGHGPDAHIAAMRQRIGSMMLERIVMSDVLIDMIDELRATRPPCYLADEWQAWLNAIGQAITALPTQAQRWAATILVANDLVQAMPGLPLSVAFVRVQAAIYAQPMTAKELGE